MDLGDSDQFRLETKAGDSVNFSHHKSSGWRFGEGNMDTVRHQGMVGCSSSSSAPLVESFSANIWERAVISQNIGFYSGRDQNSATSNAAVAINKDSGCPDSFSHGVDRTLDISWNPSQLKREVFLHNMTSVIPPSLSQLPANSSYIEQAASFSCFSNRNFGDVVGPFSIPGCTGAFSRGMGIVSGRQDDFQKHISSSASGIEACKAVLFTNDQETIERSPSKIESTLKMKDRGKQSAHHSVERSVEAEFSDDHDSGEPYIMMEKDSGLRKRKRSEQKTECVQANAPIRQTTESVKDSKIHRKSDRNPSSTAIKSMGKHGKQVSQPSDPPKEECIHVRARRGQATNSHSLAERVRREKISERMRFLQELVPGCSKVTGKAVMLDEIINYVQSLQQQVEFLSMKLATVNLRLDVQMEGLLAKNIPQSRAIPSSTVGFSPHMPVTCPPLHFSHHKHIPTSFPTKGSSEIPRSTIDSQLATSGGFKEPTQIKNVWDGELQNIVQMSFALSTPSNCVEVDGSKPFSLDNTKVEL